MIQLTLQLRRLVIIVLGLHPNGFVFGRLGRKSPLAWSVLAIFFDRQSRALNIQVLSSKPLVLGGKA